MKTGGAVLLLGWHLVLQGRLTCACSFSSVLKMENLLLLFLCFHFSLCFHSPERRILSRLSVAQFVGYCVWGIKDILKANL